MTACIHIIIMNRGLSLWNHKNPVNQCVYQFKYHNQRRYGILYSQELVKNSKKRNRKMEAGYYYAGTVASFKKEKKEDIIRHRYLQKK